MSIKEFILSNDDGSSLNYEIVSVLNIDKFHSLYLVYKELNRDDEILIAKLNIDNEKIYLENIDNMDEINEINKLLSERGIK